MSSYRRCLFCGVACPPHRYLCALTSDRLLCLVYDELSEPRRFKGSGADKGRVTRPHSFAGETVQAHDPFSLSVFAVKDSPASLFALRHNREFPLRRLVRVKESAASAADPRLELTFSLHAIDAQHHGARPASARAAAEARALHSFFVSSSDGGDGGGGGGGHAEDFSTVRVALRFQARGDQHAWAIALKAAAGALPGSLLECAGGAAAGLTLAADREAGFSGGGGVDGATALATARAAHLAAARHPVASSAAAASATVSQTAVATASPGSGSGKASAAVVGQRLTGGRAMAPVAATQGLLFSPMRVVGHANITDSPHATASTAASSKATATAEEKEAAAAAEVNEAAVSAVRTPAGKASPPPLPPPPSSVSPKKTSASAALFPAVVYEK